MDSRTSRRTFIYRGGLTMAGLAAMAAGRGESAPGEAPAPMPRIRLGTLEVSRLILGSNPFYGFAHQTKELAKEMTEWYTDERIITVLDEAVSHGITAVASPPYERWIRLFASYRERGGKLRTWIAQPDGPPEKMPAEIAAAVKGGAAAVFIQGARVDEQFQRETPDVVRGWVEQIRGLGVPAGMASHRPDVHRKAEEMGFPTDFYFQCFYNPTRGYLEEDREAAVRAIAEIAKPVVGYKILGAGRLAPREGFAFAFRHLREKDGVCVGVFPKHNTGQIREDVRLAARPTEA